MTNDNNEDTLRKQIRHDVMRQITVRDNGRPMYVFPDLHAPDPAAIKTMGLADVFAEADKKIQESVRLRGEANILRRNANRLNRDGMATTAERDAAEIEATTAERDARPLEHTARRALVDAVTEYRLALPAHHATFAEEALEAHRDAERAYDALRDALDRRASAASRIGGRIETGTVGLTSGLTSGIGDLGKAAHAIAADFRQFPTDDLEAIIEEGRA